MIIKAGQKIKQLSTNTIFTVLESDENPNIATLKITKSTPEKWQMLLLINMHNMLEDWEIIE